MKAMFDTNILLDVFQNRQPHYGASAACLNEVLYGQAEGSIPAHAMTTFHYVLRKYRDEDTARDAIRWLMKHFCAASCDHAVLEAACASGMTDFEDAVVAFSAERAGCICIVTRNVNDFRGSPIPAFSPEQFLDRLRKA